MTNEYIKMLDLGKLPEGVSIETILSIVDAITILPKPTNEVELKMNTYNLDPEKNNYMVKALMKDYDLHAGWISNEPNSTPLFLNIHAYIPNLPKAMYNVEKTFTAIKEDFLSYEDMDIFYIDSIKQIYNHLYND